LWSVPKLVEASTKLSMAPPTVSQTEKRVVSFRPEDGERGEPPGGPSGGSPDEEFPASGEERSGRGRRGRLTGRLGIVPIIVGVLVLALLIGGLLLWSFYGDRAGGTSVFEDSIESGPEPVVRLTNGAGRVRIEGVEGLENVEITARRYARGRNPAVAKENAIGVPVEVASGDSGIEISSDGGGGTGVDYELRVPAGSAVEAESAAGDVDVSGVDSSATVRTENGDVTVEDVQGAIVIETLSGDVTVGDVSTETGDAEITVVSGDLELRDLVVGILEARVGTGDVTVSGRFSGSGRVLVEVGSIDVRIPPEDVRELTFETRVGETSRDEESE
jgi:hypothetical protein